MQDLSFSIDFIAVILILLLGGLSFVTWRWGKIFHSPHVKFSDLASLKSGKASTRELYANLPFKLMLAALALFALAFIDPHYYVQKKKDEKEQPPIKQVNIPTEGIAIYFVLDQSGSMSQEVKGRRSRRVKMTKMDLLKDVTRQFIEGDPKAKLKGRPNDMLGLVAFARGAQVLAPLTLDHNAVLKELDKLNYTTDLDQDGTSIGYAIFKTANLIAATRHYAQELVGEGEPAYDIKSTVMILVTDGFQSPNPLDKGKRLRNIELVEAADYARANDIRMYVINVEPRMASKEFALYRKLMKQISELTGGKFYLVDSTMGLDKIYSEIDQLEKSKLPVETTYVTPPKSQLPHLYRRVSFYPYLIAMGMLCMVVTILLETVFMRRVP